MVRAGLAARHKSLNGTVGAKLSRGERKHRGDGAELAGGIVFPPRLFASETNIRTITGWEVATIRSLLPITLIRNMVLIASIALP